MTCFNTITEIYGMAVSQKYNNMTQQVSQQMIKTSLMSLLIMSALNTYLIQNKEMLHVVWQHFTTIWKPRHGFQVKIGMTDRRQTD